MSRDLYLSSVVPIGVILLVRVSLCSSLAFLLVEPVNMSRDLYLSFVVPIGAILLVRVSLCSSLAFLLVEPSSSTPSALPSSNVAILSLISRYYRYYFDILMKTYWICVEISDFQKNDNIGEISPILSIFYTMVPIHQIIYDIKSEPWFELPKQSNRDTSKLDHTNYNVFHRGPGHTTDDSYT
ncbi:hypothetical protein ACFX1X_023827 [Malus domestica]